MFSQSSSSLKLSVSFANERMNQTIELPSFSSVGSAEELWYQPWQFKKFRQDQKIDAKIWRKEGYGILLERVFLKATKETQCRLNAISQLDDTHCFRGMERYLNRKFDEERTSKRTSTVQQVLDLQDVLRYRSGGGGDQAGGGEVRMELQLANLLHQRSRSARAFARRLGKADEQFVIEGERPEKAWSFMEEAKRLLQQQQRRSSAPERALARWDSSGSMGSASSAESGVPRLPRRINSRDKRTSTKTTPPPPPPPPPTTITASQDDYSPPLHMNTTNVVTRSAPRQPRRSSLPAGLVLSTVSVNINVNVAVVANTTTRPAEETRDAREVTRRNHDMSTRRNSASSRTKGVHSPPPPISGRKHHHHVASAVA